MLSALLYASLALSTSVIACTSHSYARDNADLIRSNNLRRNSQASQNNQTVITNVRVFTGRALTPSTTVYIDKDGLISAPFSTSQATTVDGQGGVLLPGLIDSHTHPSSTDNLATLASFGITTTIVASCFPDALCQSLSNHPGLTDVRYSAAAATSPNSTHALLPGFPQDELLSSPTDAPAFVQRQVDAGASFIKLVAESPSSNTTLSTDTLSALVTSAHAHGKQALCHAASHRAAAQALAARADQVHHSPLDEAFDPGLVAQFVAQQTVSVPTLTMMRAMAQGSSDAFARANASVALLHAASVPILAGTDASTIGANNVSIPGFPPASELPAFGKSLHDELENLVDAGLSPVEALRAATAVPVAMFGDVFGGDRGAVEVGKRADLVLLGPGADPTVNISKTREVARVWIAGVEFESGN